MKGRKNNKVAIAIISIFALFMAYALYVTRISLQKRLKSPQTCVSKLLERVSTKSPAPKYKCNCVIDGVTHHFEISVPAFFVSCVGGRVVIVYEKGNVGNYEAIFYQKAYDMYGFTLPDTLSLCP